MTDETRDYRDMPDIALDMLPETVLELFINELRHSTASLQGWALILEKIREKEDTIIGETAVHINWHAEKIQFLSDKIKLYLAERKS